MFEQKERPKVSIVIPSWFVNDMHGRHGLHETFFLASECMKRLVEFCDKSLYELIVIDNGSTLKKEDINYDDVSHWSDKFTPDWYWLNADILIRNSKNLGFGKAMNQGVALASGEYILLLNNDIFIYENFLEYLLEVFNHEELEPPIGASMCNLIKKEFQTDCLTEDGKKLDSFKVLNLKEKDIVFKNKERYESGAEFGSAIMMKKDLVEQIRKMNGGYQLYNEDFVGFFCEDRYLYDQIRECGFQTYRTNQLRVCHFGNLTITKVPDKRQYGIKNRKLLAELREKKLKS